MKCIRSISVLLILLGISGCSLVSNSTGSEEMTKMLKESYSQRSSAESQGTTPMVGVARTYNVRAGGDVTFPAQTGDAAEVEQIIKNLKADLIEAQSKMKISQKSSEDMSARIEQSEAYHKKWHVISGVAILLMALAALLAVFAISRFRAEISKWGFDPTSVGRIASGMASTIKDGVTHLDEEFKYVNRRVAENGISAEAKAELMRQRDAIKSLKGILGSRETG